MGKAGDGHYTPKEFRKGLKYVNDNYPSAGGLL